MNTATPCSDYIETRGLVFFARMLDKLRLHAAGQLSNGYNIGISEPSCFDARFCRFWEVDYDRIREETLAGKSNEEVLTAILGSGPLNPERVLAWNALILKRGWRDDVSAELEEVKHAHGFSNRPDIQTFVDFHDADEGRIPRNA
jgi:hypothetical protein